MSEGLPEGFQLGTPRKSHKGSVKVSPPVRGLAHFQAWGTALDAALDAMDDADSTPWSVTFTATIGPKVDQTGADPGIVIEYIATVT